MKELRKVTQGTPSSFALRYVASHPQVFMILSGMASEEQMEDNIQTMTHFVPFSREEYETADKIRDILFATRAIPCTSCHYCTPGCPMKIKIPEIFTICNSETLFHSWTSKEDYQKLTEDSTPASRCIHCNQCQRICPQHLPIPSLLEEAAKKFED